jgi:replicative DNA helicase
MTEDYGKLLGSVGYDTLQELWRLNQAPISAVPTMLPTWNGYCRDEGGGVGLAHGWHIVVGGKTGSGKSIFGLNLAVRAMKRKDKVGFISLEMSYRQLITRAIAMYTGISVSDLEPGFFYKDDQFQKATQRWVDEAEHLLFVNREPISTLDDIERAIIKAYDLEGVKYFVTDYLQLAWVSQAESLFTQITEVSHTIRALARKLGVVSIGLSQFNRETSKSKERPEVTGLMSGSSLENDADQVILLDHTTYKKRTVRSATQEILLAKNRHGSSGRIAVQWDYRDLTISEVDATEDDSDQEVPF